LQTEKIGLYLQANKKMHILLIDSTRNEIFMTFSTEKEQLSSKKKFSLVLK